EHAAVESARGAEVVDGNREMEGCGHARINKSSRLSASTALRDARTMRGLMSGTSPRFFMHQLLPHRVLPQAWTLLAGALLAGAAAWAAPSGSATTPIGFMQSSIEGQRALEQKFDAQLQASDLQAWMKQMSAKPTHVGAPHDKANAELTQQQLRSWGWD